MRYILFMLRTLWLPLLLLPAACGGTHTAGETSTPSHVPVPANEQFLADLPQELAQLDELAGSALIERKASEAYLNFPGSAFSLDSGAGNHPVGGSDAFALDVQPGSSAWAMYSLFVAPGELPLSLQLRVSDEADVGQAADPSLPYWIGAANFASGRWQWFGSYSTHESQVLLPAGSQTDYLSPMHISYWVVLSHAAPGAGVVTPAVEDGTLVTNGSGGNLYPQPFLVVAPGKAAPGQTVNLDASTSMDPDGTIVNYEWDLDGDNQFSEPGQESLAGGQPSLNYTLVSPGQWNMTVRVTDDDGAQQSFSVPVTCTGWQVFDLVSGTVSGPRVYSLASIGNRPALTYLYSKLVRYAIAATAYGAAADDWVHVPLADLDGSAPVSEAPLAQINNRPAVAMRYGASRDLWYFHSSSPSGTAAADWSSVVVDDYAGDVGYNCSLAAVNDFPAIAYSDDTNTMLRYAVSTDPNGAADWSVVFVDNHGDNIATPSLAFDGTRPWIFYSRFQATDYEVGAFHSSSVDGGIWSDWSLQYLFILHGTVYTNGHLIRCPGSPVDTVAGCLERWTPGTGLFAIEYEQYDPVTAGWNTSDAVQDIAQLYNPKLAITPDGPSVAYYNSGDSTVYISRNQQLDGQSLWSLEKVEKSVSVGDNRVLVANINSRICLAYADQTRHVVRYAIRWD